MLDPQSRQHLFEALRPPEGYLLDYALGTTYSLDLMALLTVPLAFTFFGTGQEIGQTDPLALLDGVRRYANQLTIFCQAGQIVVPPKEQLLFSYLEQTVVEVTPRSPHGVFHPKVWALRFVPDSPIEDQDKAGPVQYRFLCLSRNLTFDRSWDTILSLDGELIDRQYAYGQNHPLGDFFEALPNLAIRPVPDLIQERVEQFQYELRRVRFKKPYPFESFDFFPMGLKRGESWPFGDYKRRLLIISPFLTAGFTSRITTNCSDNILISRLDGPNGLESLTAEQLAPFNKIYVLSQNANPEEQDSKVDGRTQPVVTEFNPPLSGLHAKIFIAEQGGLKRRVHLWTGSANATDAAIKHNVEFMVRLVGRERDLAIEKLLEDREGEIDLWDLLEEYQPPEEAEIQDETELKLDGRLRHLQRLIFKAEFVAEVIPKTDEERFDVRLTWSMGSVDEVLKAATVTCWPITISEENAVTLTVEAQGALTIGALSFEALTSFFAFEVKTRVKDKVGRRRFVLNMPLTNAPKKRQERVLRHLLSDRNSVLRYLLLLLAEGGDIYAAGSEAIRLITNPTDGRQMEGLDLPIHLFEALTQTLAHHPEKLDQINRLVTELKETDSLSLLPDGFEDVWQPVWNAREGLRNEEGKAATVDQGKWYE